MQSLLLLLLRLQTIIRLLLQQSVSDVAVFLLVSVLTVDILSTFCAVFMVKCVALMVRIFEFGV